MPSVHAEKTFWSGFAGKSPTRRVILLSIAASIVTMALKIGAYLFTGSVSLLSDAMESSVNLIAASVAFIAITVADRPADRSHAYGHDKAEYFSSGVEGSLILVAAVLIIYTAVQRFMHPSPLIDLGLGLTIAIIASGINFGVSRFMLRAAKRYDSIILGSGRAASDDRRLDFGGRSCSPWSRGADSSQMDNSGSDYCDTRRVKYHLHRCEPDQALHGRAHG